MKASLLLVLNEQGQVLRFEITPSDTRDLIRNTLLSIWNIPGRDVITECIYTDNVKADKLSIEAAYNCLSQHQEKTIDVL